MQLYDVHVRLGNTTTSEVPKFGITPAEIMVLRQIHGIDSVVKVRPVNKATVSNAAERERLRSEYERAEHQAGIVARLFGPEHLPLPDTLDPVSEAAAAEAVAAKEAEEAAQRAEIDAEVAKQVEAMRAQVEAEMREKIALEAVNSGVDKKNTLSLKGKGN